MRIKVNGLFFVFVGIVFFSCAIHRYRLDTERWVIFAKCGCEITGIDLYEKSGDSASSRLLASFLLRKGASGDCFSLRDFSPDRFKMWGNIEGFSGLEKGKKYYVDVYPSGDRECIILFEVDTLGRLWLLNWKWKRIKRRYRYKGDCD